jgi:CoA:oxalate CoA-transferase
MSVWLDKLNDAGVPCSPINKIDDVLQHPQLSARNMFIHVQGESTRKVRTAGNPVRMSTSPDEEVTIVRKAPAVGEHRAAILAELMAASGAYASQARTESRDDVELTGRSSLAA